MGRDGIAGLVVLVVSVVLFGLTFRIQSNPLVPVSPAFYPRLVLGATAVLSALMVAIDLVKRRRAGPTPAPAKAAAAKPRYDMVVILFAIFAVYVLVLPYLGFRIGTAAFLAVMQYAMARPRSLRAWIVLALVALVATAATHAMFETYLQVLLPRGRWTDF
ncbi:MAG TPA: tripartite tricarboxylate transporter TctB family protein [Usitatibacter sp.]|nr:tripartite tricarboxylate transporter TctB family protein [Usitatibacter sp.]HXS51360.1 tripartite tricarboxylate transporter TctB family protein [Usitatibacter sp.]